MKEVMISIKPEWVEKILNGEKTIEIRKTYPTAFKDTFRHSFFDTSDKTFKVYIYCTLEMPKCKYGDYEGNHILFYDIRNKKHILGNRMTCAWDMDNFNILNGRVVAEFTCDSVSGFWSAGDYDVYRREHWEKYTGLSLEEIDKYANGKVVYLWHISNLKIYDKPKELKTFKHLCISKKLQCSGCKYLKYVDKRCEKCKCCREVIRPPQSWCYVEGVRYVITNK